MEKSEKHCFVKKEILEIVEKSEKDFKDEIEKTVEKLINESRNFLVKYMNTEEGLYGLMICQSLYLGSLIAFLKLDEKDAKKLLNTLSSESLRAYKDIKKWSETEE